MSVFDPLPPGTPLGTLEITVSAEANERYWRAAGADHEALRAGLLYPPIAANLTILLFRRSCPDAMIQTRQLLRCHRAERSGTPLVVTGRAVDRYEKRGRQYLDVEAVVASRARPGEPIWTSTVTFTPAAGIRAAS